MLRIESIREGFYLPTKAYKGDAGFDVKSMENKIMQPGEVYKFKLGFRILGEPGKVYITEDRSSLASKGFIVVGRIIDNGYRGEVSVILNNTLGCGEIEIKVGDKIAQILVHNVDDDNLLIADDEPIQTLLTERENHGTGSSGK